VQKHAHKWLQVLLMARTIVIGCLRSPLKALATICVRAFAPLSGQISTVFALLAANTSFSEVVNISSVDIIAKSEALSTLLKDQ
jgi:hypothetical protein